MSIKRRKTEKIKAEQIEDEFGTETWKETKKKLIKKCFPKDNQEEVTVEQSSTKLEQRA